MSQIIKKLELKNELNKEDLFNIVQDFKEKKLNDEDIKNLVVLWRKKKETPDELKELAELINKLQNQKEIHKDAVDICGTGGDKSNTFNVSTLAAIVATSCKVKIIKHSGRSTTSISGSVDILNEFGFDIDTPDEIKENCFKQTGLMIVSSKVLREIFSDVKKICKKINSPGFVNLLGPLTNPYKTSYHLLGVSSIEWGKLLAETLVLLDKKEALIVCSKIADGNFLDEFSFCGENYIWHITDGKIKEDKINLQDLGHKLVNPGDLVVGNINDSKRVFEDILRGRLNKGPKSEIVALNAGAALYLAKKVKSVSEGYDFALRNIHSGKAWEHLQIFLNCNKKVKVRVE